MTDRTHELNGFIENWQGNIRFDLDEPTRTVEEVVEGIYEGIMRSMEHYDLYNLADVHRGGMGVFIEQVRNPHTRFPRDPHKHQEKLMKPPNTGLLLAIYCWAVASRTAHDNIMLLHVSNHTDWIGKLCAERMTTLEQLNQRILAPWAVEQPQELIRYRDASREFESPERCCMVKSSPPCEKCHRISKEFFAAREALEEFGIPLLERLHGEHSARMKERYSK